MSENENLSINNIMTTNELATKLGLNSAYVLRLVKDPKNGLVEGIDFRSAGKRNYLFTLTAFEKLEQLKESR